MQSRKGAADNKTLLKVVGQESAGVHSYGRGRGSAEKRMDQRAPASGTKPRHLRQCGQGRNKLVWEAAKQRLGGECCNFIWVCARSITCLRHKNLRLLKWVGGKKQVGGMGLVVNAYPASIWEAEVGEQPRI